MIFQSIPSYSLELSLKSGSRVVRHVHTYAKLFMFKNSYCSIVNNKYD